MTYLVPLLDVLGKQPIWLVAILPIICSGLKCTSLVQTCSVVISAGCILFVADGGGRSLVERIFIFVLRMCPFDVVIDSGRYLRTMSAVRPGHAAKKSESMAAIQVEGTGLNAAW